MLRATASLVVSAASGAIARVYTTSSLVDSASRKVMLAKAIQTSARGAATDEVGPCFAISLSVGFGTVAVLTTTNMLLIFPSFGCGGAAGVLAYAAMADFIKRDRLKHASDLGQHLNVADGVLEWFASSTPNEYERGPVTSVCTLATGVKPPRVFIGTNETGYIRACPVESEYTIAIEETIAASLRPADIRLGQ